jgi:hypothetical protein
MKVEAALTLEKIRHDQDTDAHLVLTLTAPSIEAQTKRPRLCIIPLIDVSPSMYENRGEKIAYAKRSVEKLIDHLSPTDYCGLVQFSMDAQVVCKPMKVTADNKATLKRAVAGLTCGNATNIADALLKGLELGNKLDLPGDVIVRVVLFTDGQANRGPATDMAGLVRLLEANLGSCTASAFGYGADADQNLLGELAKKGSGNYAFVQNPDDALTAFGKELGGLLSTYATNLLLNVTAAGEHEITEVVSDVDSEEEKIGQGVRIKIPDILAEEVRHIVLGVKLKAQKGNGGPRAVNVFNVKAGWDILDANSKKERKGEEAKAKAQFVKEGEESKEPNADLAKIVSLAQVVRAQLEAEELAKKGNFQGAVQRMQVAAKNLSHGGHAQAAYLADQVSQRLGSAQAYHDNGGYLRSVTTGGTRSMGGASYDAQASADLVSYGLQMSNSMQTSTSNAFAGGGQSIVVGDAPVASQFSPLSPMGPVASGGIGAFPVGVGGGFDLTGGAILNGQPVAVAGVVVPDPGLIAAPPPAPAPSPRTSQKASKSSSKKTSGLSKKSKSW